MIRLYVRARNGPGFAVALVAVALVAWCLADWLVHRPFSAGPSARLSVVVLAPALAATVLSTTLRSDAEELERSTARRWWRIRLVRAVAATTACAIATAVIGLWEPAEFGAWALARNTVAAAGIVAATAAVSGAATAWLVAVCHAVAVRAVAAQPDPEDWWWAWPTQPSDLVASWWVAAWWGVVGLVAYAARGSRARTERDG